MTTTTNYKITWYGYFDGERVRLAKWMRPRGYDATCSCGWDSRSGGAIRASVQRDVHSHKIDHEIDAELAASGQTVDELIAQYLNR